MIYPHHFPGDLSRYATLGKANEFPSLDYCPVCRAKNRLLRHGFYERNALEQHESYRISICRLRCPDCGRTVSILPTFLLPYFQHTLAFILHILLTFWLALGLLVSRQLLRFYEKRVYGKQTEMELFFREMGYHEPFPPGRKEKAITMLQMVQALGKATFTRRWWDHQVSSFMAASLYHGTRVAKTE